MNIPKLSLEEFRAVCNGDNAEKILEETYQPFLEKLHVHRKNDVRIIRNLVSEIIGEMFDVETDRTVRDIMSGRIRFESEEDIEKIPNYRKQHDDGTVEIINISEHIQPWLSLQTWLNEYCNN